MNQSDVTQAAIKSMLTYCALTFVLSVVALICILTNAAEVVGLILCFLIMLPGLAISKFFEIKNVWQGKEGDAKAETWAALPGVASILIALCFAALLYRFTA